MNTVGWAKDDYMDVGGRLCLEQKVEERRAQQATDSIGYL